MNETTGSVTLVAAGETTIKATFAGNDKYEPAEASYKLTVSNKATMEVSCPSNEYNPDVAGIVSRQESGTTISNCIVDNTTIKAISSINESGPEQHAGGIVARTYDGATISSCQVINGTEIQNYNENMNVSCLYAGAIVGNNAGNYAPPPKHSVGTGPCYYHR